MIIYRSQDDGTLYREHEVDYYPEGYTRYEVPDAITLTADQVCGHYGDIMEILIGAGQATRLEDE